MICVSVQEKSFGDCRAILESCEMAELRADLCRLSVEEVERLVEIRPNLIATCRIANSSEAFAREQLAAAIRRGARYVDIEIEAPDEHLEYVRTLAREYGCWLIVSFHDFEGTPSLDELKGIARLCRTKGADLVKIVTTAWNISDAARTMRLYDLQADGALFEGAAAAERPQLVAFSMGEAGKFTRLLCLKLGAPYTYVSAGASNATASGQYTREEMERLLSAENYPFEGFREFRRTTVAVPCSKSVAQRAVLRERSPMFPFEVDPTSDLPLWVQLRNRIAYLINDGTLAPGDKLPTVRGLASEISINYNTVNKAYLSLVSDGYLESTRGRGVFVTDLGAKMGAEGEGEADAVLDECIASCRELGMGLDDIERAMSRKIKRLKYDEARERGEVSARIIDFEKPAVRAEKGA